MFRAKSWPVIHARESHRPDLSDCPPTKRLWCEPGSKIISACARDRGELIIDKPGKGMFYATGLGAILKIQAITDLISARVTTQVCVQTSMREANDRGHDCPLVEVATASCFPHFKTATIEMIRTQGGNVGWTTTLAQLAGALA